MLVDAHQHFWAYDPGEYAWISPALGVLRRDFLPPDLQAELNAAGVDGCIAVQARQSLKESRWLLELAERWPFILGVVGWADLCSSSVADELKALAAHPKFRGLRHVAQDEPDDRFLLRPDFMRGLEKLQGLGLTYDLLVYPRQLRSAIELVRAFPGLNFVLDHLAKPKIKTREIEPWKSEVFELAAHSNVCCKVSGMVTEADWSAWKPSDLRPYLDAVSRAFGPERLLFGSDWPVCTLAASYGRVFQVVQDYLRPLPAGQREAVLGGNALRVYGCQAP